MIIAIHLTNLIIRSLQPKVLQSNRMIMDLDTKFAPADEYTGIFVYDINTHNTIW